MIRRDLSEERAIEAVSALRRATIAPVDEPLALEAADLSLAHGLAMADSLVYATARRFGAISGVLGGYILLFPLRPVRAVIFYVFTTVPAYVAIGIWIGYQLILGYMTTAGSGGVAYSAHIGGFVAGLVLVKLFAIGRNT